ncbi:acyltransferase family protein [Microbacterium sp. NPDC058342]|uniref:acyltransferase family protein n=1 Tax=Microbacterium sp. NPDC058342 TaxID=3346454 RepID=UPI00365D6494
MSSDDGHAKRLIVPDVLRGVAILAMLIAHAAPFLPDLPWAARFLSGNINDLASPLFALVMGMSAQLLWNRSRSTPVTLMQQIVRGIILVLLGLWMASWGSWVAIVLQPLGVLLVVGVPLLLLGTRMLWAVALFVLVISQPVVSAAREGAWWFFAQGQAASSLADWTLNGNHYRVMNLLPFFLLGALLIRRGLKRDGFLWTMAVLAPVMYLPATAIKALDLVPVTTGDYFDTLHDAGLVFAVYVLIVLIVTAKASPRNLRVRDAVVTPVRAWGQLALSLYLLHVAVIAAWNNGLGRPDHNIPVGWLLIVPGMGLIAWLWWRYVGTGPVEWLMGFVTRRPKPLRQPRPHRRDEAERRA